MRWTSFLSFADAHPYEPGPFPVDIPANYCTQHSSPVAPFDCCFIKTQCRNLERICAQSHYHLPAPFSYRVFFGGPSQLRAVASRSRAQLTATLDDGLIGAGKSHCKHDKTSSSPLTLASQVHPLRISKNTPVSSGSPVKMASSIPRPLSEISPMEKRRNSPSWNQATKVGRPSFQGISTWVTIRTTC